LTKTLEKLFREKAFSKPLQKALYETIVWWVAASLRRGPPFCGRSLIAGVKPGKPLAVPAKRRSQLPEVRRGGVNTTGSERFFRLYPEN